MGFLSIDQEKAFDRVDHGYLFSALSSFGFGERFISWVKLLYRDVSVLVKVGGGLSASVPVKRGIRQGCSLSGQLYSIAIEPLLRRIRRDLKGFSIPNDVNCNKIVLSAYADDVTVFINGQDDVINLTKSIEVYERASTAKVNWGKCEGYAVGQWINQRLPDLPGGLKWGREGFKALGVFWVLLGFRVKIGRDCWRRWWPDYLGGDGYYHKCLTRGEFWSLIIWLRLHYGTS